MTNETFDHYVLKTYNREKITFQKGKGSYLYDDRNRKWLDFISGIGVTGLGHCHPLLVKTLKKQASKLWHTSNLYYIQNQGKTAQLLSEVAFPGKTFFCNSGAEANEAAIKLSRKWGNSQNPKKNIILSLKQSFHGRTLAALTLTGQAIHQKGFDPLPPGFDYVEANNLEELESKMNDSVAALFLEPVQGEGGVVPLKSDFVKKARDLTRRHKALLIFDEVQTGIGRTGKMFGFQNFETEPDAITLAKGLGNGIPIGALHVKNEFAILQPGEHASTFGGNFLATAVSLQVLKILKDGLLKKATKNAEYLKEQLKTLPRDFSLIQEVRGMGFMWGIVTDRAAEIYRGLLEKRILTTNQKNQVIRILPALVLKKKEIDLFIKGFREVLKSLEGINS